MESTFHCCSTQYKNIILAITIFQDPTLSNSIVALSSEIRMTAMLVLLFVRH
jgi:hypothetical protein